MPRQYPIRGPAPLIVNEDTARQYPVRDTVLNDTTPVAVTPTAKSTVLFVAT
jgi:hypothetical protein